MHAPSLQPPARPAAGRKRGGKTPLQGIVCHRHCKKEQWPAPDPSAKHNGSLSSVKERTADNASLCFILPPLFPPAAPVCPKGSLKKRAFKIRKRGAKKKRVKTDTPPSRSSPQCTGIPSREPSHGSHTPYTEQ